MKRKLIIPKKKIEGEISLMEREDVPSIHWSTYQVTVDGIVVAFLNMSLAAKLIPQQISFVEEEINVVGIDY